ncbi:hypothetical protein LINPERHAP2_LOCUS27526 [Linum perenne]
MMSAIVAYGLHKSSRRNFLPTISKPSSTEILRRGVCREAFFYVSALRELIGLTRLEMDMRKWNIRPEGAPNPDYGSVPPLTRVSDVAGKEFHFTVEMHYDGILTGDEYKFGSVAFIDRVDPDYFSLLELMKMAEHVGLEEEYYQFLWTKPGEEIKDGLRPLECEDDILTCIGEDGLNKKHHLLKVFVRKMTRFEAWKRMVDIQKQLCGSLHAPGDGFVLEEIGEEGNTITGEAGGSGSTGFGNPMLLEFIPTMAVSLHPDTAGNPEAPLVADAGGEHMGPGGQTEKNADVVVNETGMTSSQAADVPFNPQPSAINPSTEVPAAVEVEPSTEVDPLSTEVPIAVEVEPSTEVDPLSTEVPIAAEVEPSMPVGNTRWLEIDEILAEMHNEMLAEAEAVHIPVNDDNESFSSPTIYSSDSQQEYWDGRYNAYSSEDSDRSFHSRGFLREATPDSSDDDDDTFIPEGLDHASLSVDSFDRPSSEEPDSGMDSNDGGSDDRSESHSEEMLEERGWGSEEDQEFQPDQYPPFSAERDLEHAEIVIGKEFESLAAFKDFCKVNAIRSRRGVKFTVNDKIRCKCECMQKCGFRLYARIRGGSDTGLQNVLEREFPDAEHRYCARHLYVNYSRKFSRSRALRNMFWAACKATNKGDFDLAMHNFREKGDKYKTSEGLTPLEWMQRRGVKTWCKYYFDTMTSCDNSLNNHCESFNRWILEARDMPILSCLEIIRFKMMKRVHANYVRVASLDHEALCPNAWVRIRERKQRAAYCYPTFSGAGQYEVREGLRSWVVDLRLSQCACGLWQLSGLPCEHALTCIAHNKEAVESYCDPCYKVST